MTTYYRFEPCANGKDCKVWVNKVYKGEVSIDQICNYIIYYKGVDGGLADCVKLRKGFKVFFVNCVNDLVCN